MTEFGDDLLVNISSLNSVMEIFFFSFVIFFSPTSVHMIATKLLKMISIEILALNSVQNYKSDSIIENHC